jgi:hypothetical protein
VVALLLHQVDVRLGHADLLEKVPNRFHHRPLYGLILVAGEEIDVVFGDVGKSGSILPSLASSFARSDKALGSGMPRVVFIHL